MPEGTDQTLPARLQPVSAEGFAGPLDLLLHLIAEGRYDVSRLSLAAVTEQYLSRLRSLPDVPPEHLADFLVVAATLLLLRSKTLFPDLALLGEEEEKIASLESQLREYQRFRTAAKEFRARWEQGEILRARAPFLGSGVAFYPPPGFTGASFRTAMAAVLDHVPHPLERLPAEVVRRVARIEEHIRDIERRVAESASVSFREVAAAGGSRLAVIVSFLALLELVKRRLVQAEQRGDFHDILIARRFNGTESSA